MDDYIYIYIYIYKQDLSLINLQWLLCHKTKPTKKKKKKKKKKKLRGAEKYLKMSKIRNRINCGAVDFTKYLDESQTHENLA